MRVTVYPADSTGCGHFRLIWAAQALIAEGHDIDLRPPDRRDLKIKIAGEAHDIGAYVEDVLGEQPDVVVFQRTTHRFLAQAIPILRSKGVAVVIDVDDDLTAIHPRNPAYAGYHPKNEWNRDRSGKFNRHSWHNLTAACQAATLVTVSSTGLLDVYARHGRGRVIHNHLPEHYYGVPHVDSDLVGWPAYLPTHPDDPSSLGGAVARLYDDGGLFQVIADPNGCGAAFGLPQDPPGHAPVSLTEWPHAVSKLGIGLCPLSDTKFNKSKSWLKPLELSALGVPWIGSPRPEYLKLSGMGCGLMADTPRRWYQAINRLRNSPALREDLAEGGKAVAEVLRLEPNAWKWMDAWTDAYRLQHLNEPVRTVL